MSPFQLPAKSIGRTTRDKFENPFTISKIVVRLSDFKSCDEQYVLDSSLKEIMFTYRLIASVRTVRVSLHQIIIRKHAYYNL